MVEDKVGTAPGEFGVIKSMECDTSSLIALTLLVGRQEEYLACKQLGVDLLVMTISPELWTSCSCSCHHSVPPSSLATIKSRTETF